MVVSLVLVSLVATTLTVAGILSEASAFLALAAICLAGCALQVAEESWGSVSPKKS